MSDDLDRRAADPLADPAFVRTLGAFREATSIRGDVVHAARAALLIARGEDPALDVETYETHLERLSRTLETRIHPAAEPVAQIEAANALLLEEQGLRGNDAQYGDPRNLLLHEVIERRLGIPVTLVLIYVEVCRGAGLPMRPVGLPGHVIARLDADDGPHFIDVYHDGQELDADGCRSLVRSIYGSRTPFRDQYLEPITSRQLLQRLLYNLKAGALRRGDEAQAARAIELLLTLFPWDLDEVRDRGMLRERVGDQARALEDLELYVQFRNGARDMKTIAEAVRSLRRHVDEEPE